MHLENLKKRAACIRAMRRFFDERGFVEVATPLLSAEAIADRHVEPLAIDDPTLPSRPMLLQTSPELPMKRLLAAGMDAIYQLGPVFRRGDRGTLHNVEFTMLEWYRCGDDYLSGRILLGEFLDEILRRGMPEERTFAKVFFDEFGINPHRIDCRELKAIADAHKVVYPESFPGSADIGAWIDLLFSECLQPYLGLETPLLIYDFPVWQNQLARTHAETLPDGSQYEVARRFEVFVDGLELANGYDELFDAEILAARLEAINRQRGDDGHRVISQERFLEAMHHSIPPCCGCALGVDRLLMILLGAPTIDGVLTFPIENA